jgi:hypothetical protein
VATQDLCEFRTGLNSSEKYDAVIKLQANGSALEIMGEEAFIYLIDQRPAVLK